MYILSINNEDKIIDLTNEYEDEFIKGFGLDIYETVDLLDPDNKSIKANIQSVIFKDTDRNVEIDLTSKVLKMILFCDIYKVSIRFTSLKHNGIHVELNGFDDTYRQKYSFNIYTVMDDMPEHCKIDFIVRCKKCPSLVLRQESIEFPLDINKYKIIDVKKDYDHTVTRAKDSDLIWQIEQYKSGELTLLSTFILMYTDDKELEIFIDGDKIDLQEILCNMMSTYTTKGGFSIVLNDSKLYDTNHETFNKIKFSVDEYEALKAKRYM